MSIEHIIIALLAIIDAAVIYELVKACGLLSDAEDIILMQEGHILRLKKMIEKRDDDSEGGRGSKS